MNSKISDRTALALTVGVCVTFVGLFIAACVLVSETLLVAALAVAGCAFAMLIGLIVWPPRERERPRVRRLMQACFLITIGTIPLVGFVFPVCSIMHLSSVQHDAWVRMSEIAKGMHAYAGTHDTRLPPHAIYSKDGKPLLSWRVALLPYLGHEDLYRRFKLDEPWDSPHNLALAAEMPAVYAPPRGWGEKGVPHATYFVVYVGPGAAFEGTSGVRLDDFPDGKDKTVLFVVAEDPVTWTRPQDLTFPAQGPPPRPYMRTGDYQLSGVMMVQGRGPSVSPGTTDAELRALITRNGGEPVPEW